jgi:hypothetical protein
MTDVKVKDLDLDLRAVKRDPVQPLVFYCPTMSPHPLP